MQPTLRAPGLWSRALRTTVLRGLVPLVIVFAAAAVARAEVPTSQDAHFVNGQVWVTWTSPALDPIDHSDDCKSYEIYMRTQSNPTWELVGQVYPADYDASRLASIYGAAHGEPSNGTVTTCDGGSPVFVWTIPNPNVPGALMPLPDHTGLFVYTPHASGTVAFTVVAHGTPVGAMPPVHTVTVDAAQEIGVYPQMCVKISVADPDFGRTYNTYGDVYAHWIDGREDWTDERPDYPVMGNAHSAGIAQLFTVWHSASPPASSAHLLVSLHSTDGDCLDGNPARVRTSRLTNGIVCTIDDALYMNQGGPGPKTRSTLWIGYPKTLDRFQPGAAPAPSDPIIPYTFRRVDWIRNWLLTKLKVNGQAASFDPERVAIGGFSAGAYGAGMQMRWRPENWCAAMLFKCAVGPVNDDPQMAGAVDNPILLPCSAGALSSPNPNCSPTLRSFLKLQTSPSATDPSFFQVYWGQGDGPVPFFPTSQSPYTPSIQIGDLDLEPVAVPLTTDLLRPNPSLGAALFWDSSIHPVAQCGSNDMQAYWTCYPHLNGDYLFRFGRHTSYPAFFDASNQPITTTSPGTRGGYFQWDAVTESIANGKTTWSAEAYIDTQMGSPTSVETDVTIRRGQNFRPPPGTVLHVTYPGYSGRNPVVASDGTWSAHITLDSSTPHKLLTVWYDTPTVGVGDSVGVAVTSSSAPAFALKNQNASGAADYTFSYGSAGSNPIRGNWDCDAADSIGTYNPASGTFSLKNENAAGAANITFTYAPTTGTGLLPIAGDWNGDGTDSVGLYDPATATFYLRNYNVLGPTNISFTFGAPNLVPIAGDWDGDGVDTVGVYNASTGTFSLRNATGGSTVFVFGTANRIPIAGDWDGDGVDTVGVYNPANGEFLLQKAGGNLQFMFGTVGSSTRPLAGNWNGR